MGTSIGWMRRLNEGRLIRGVEGGVFGRSLGLATSPAACRAGVRASETRTLVRVVEVCEIRGFVGVLIPACCCLIALTAPMALRLLAQEIAVGGNWRTR